jgi:hypothetical protein
VEIEERLEFKVFLRFLLSEFFQLFRRVFWLVMESFCVLLRNKVVVLLAYKFLPEPPCAMRQCLHLAFIVLAGVVHPNFRSVEVFDLEGVRFIGLLDQVNEALSLVHHEEVLVEGGDFTKDYIVDDE